MEAGALCEPELSAILYRVAKAFTAPPVCHFFRTARQRYVYDGCTGEIIAVSPVAEGILRALGTESLESVAAQEAARVGTSKVSAELADLLSLGSDRNPPLFQSRGPKEIRYVYPRECYEALVSTELEQLTIIPTDACNLRCHYCVYSGKYEARPPHGGNIMSREVLDRCIDYFEERTTRSESRHLGFYGGEPTLVFDHITYAVSNLKERMPRSSYRMSVSTNLVSATPEMLQFYAENDITLYVSIDGPRHIHDRYRRFADGKATFDRIMANLRTLRDLHPEFYRSHVCLNVTLAPPYRLSEVRQFFEEEELVRDSIYMCNFVNDPRLIFDDAIDGFFDLSELDSMHKEYLQARRTGAIMNGAKCKFLRKLFDRSYLRVYQRRLASAPLADAAFCPGGVCVLGKRKLYVRWDGVLFPCERVPESDEMRMGDVFSGIDVGKVHDMLRLFVDITAEDCQKCWAILQCNQLCVRDMYLDGSPSRERKLDICRRMRDETSSLLTNMCAVLEENADPFSDLKR